MSSKLSKEELEKEVSAYRGNPLFADLAAILRSEGNLKSALEVCLAGISSNPDCLVGRLVLARIFYELDYRFFCTRELRELNALLPKNQGIRKLLDLIAPGWELDKAINNSEVKEDTIAEADFEIDVLSELDKEKT